MSEALITLPRLRSLIGLKVRHEGDACVVIEVLESPPTLVLSALASAAIQVDMHGRPLGYGQEHRMVPVLSPDGTALHDALLALDVLD